MLVVTTPIIHAVGLALNVANRIAKIVSLAHFWHPSGAHLSLKEKSLSLEALLPHIGCGYQSLVPRNGKSCSWDTLSTLDGGVLITNYKLDTVIFD